MRTDTEQPLAAEEIARLIRAALEREDLAAGRAIVESDAAWAARPDAVEELGRRVAALADLCKECVASRVRRLHAGLDAIATAQCDPERAGWRAAAIRLLAGPARGGGRSLPRRLARGAPRRWPPLAPDTRGPSRSRAPVRAALGCAGAIWPAVACALAARRAGTGRRAGAGDGRPGCAPGEYLARCRRRARRGGSLPSRRARPPC